MEIGINYTTMNIGGSIIIISYLEVVWSTLIHLLFTRFSFFIP